MKRPDKKPAGSTPAQIAERRSLNRLITDWITKLRIKASIYYNRNRYKTIAPTIVLLACLLLVHYGAKTVHSAFHVTVGRDARTFYYGSRLLLHGKNPYDDAQMVAVWAQDHAPATYKPGLPSEVFVYPPVMALLFTPAAFLPWQQGTTAVVLLNLLGAGATVVLLCMGARRRWSFEWYPAFACYALLLPATRLVITYGQSTFVICTCLAASLYALSRKWDGLGGLLLGLSLAKFTLTFPFLALLAFRRQWKPVAVALGSFCVINAILAAPIGILNAFEGFFHLVSVTTAPESVNDAFSASFRASVIVNLDRCFFLVYPDDRQIASGASRLVSLIAIVCLGYLFRRSKQTRSFVNPLEISVATLAGLPLFYHRDYDLATLMFVAYACWNIAFSIRSDVFGAGR